MAVDYSLKQPFYQGVHKSCFTVPLNIAADNCKQKGYRNLLKEAQRSKGGLSDQSIQEAADLIEKRLSAIRNYFSHTYHTDSVLTFQKEDPVKKFLETAWSYAVSETQKDIAESDYTGIVPPLFEDKEGQFQITAAGVIFLMSFFCHRSVLNRMFGSVKGLKRSDREQMGTGEKRDYQFTRKLLSFYSLRDSYAVKAEATRPFREILSYLSCVPHESLVWLSARGKLTEKEKKAFRHFLDPTVPKEALSEESAGDGSDSERPGVRKNNKFLLFAVQFIEAWSRKEKKGLEFARYRKSRVEAPGENQDGSEKRIVRFRSEIRDTQEDWPYYLRNNHALLRLHPGENKEPVDARIGEYELLYLVLAIFDGKGAKAIQKLANYIFEAKKQIQNARVYDRYQDLLPSFLTAGNKPVSAETIRNRLAYIRGELEKMLEAVQKEKKSGRWEMHKGKKIGHILRFLSNSIDDIRRRPNVKEYNRLRDLLQQLQWDEFDKALQSYVNEKLLDETVYRQLRGFHSLDELFERCCRLELKRLEDMEKAGGDRLNRYIGLEPKGKPKNYADLNTLQKKGERFLKGHQLSIPRYFLRNALYKEYQATEERKPTSLYQIVRERLPRTNPILPDRYYLLEEDPKTYSGSDSKIIREMCFTYIEDLLCMRMARWHYEQLSEKLRKKLQWKEVQTGPAGYERFRLIYKISDELSIEFHPSDLTRLDVIEKDDMLTNISQHFLTKKGTVRWTEFVSQGMKHYRDRQKQGIEALFKWEESLRIPEGLWKEEGYLGFEKVLEEAVKHGKIQDKDKEALKRIRNDFFHEHFCGTPADWEVFKRVLKRFLNQGKNEKKRFKK
jgi:hypothetical protein